MGVQKISVTVDSEMLKAARRYAPNGNLSAFVNDALSKRVKQELAREWLAEREAELGPLPEDVQQEVRRKWLD